MLSWLPDMKDFILEIYDCPNYIAKETQAGLAIIRHAAPSILGVTTPAGLSGAVSHSDWDNGLLPRFVLLTPEPDYRERPGLKKPTAPPLELTKGLRAVYDALPMPEQEGDGWKAARALPMEVSTWEAVQVYSNLLRQQCDPRRETPLDDRLKGVYGRLHVQAIKVAEICAALDWVEGGAKGPLALGERHWQMGRTIAEHWRLSAHRLLEDLNVNLLAQRSRQTEDRMLALFQEAGKPGIRLRDVYRKLKLEAAAARQTALELVRAGLLVETRVGSAEAYALAPDPAGQR